MRRRKPTCELTAPGLPPSANESQIETQFDYKITGRGPRCAPPLLRKDVIPIGTERMKEITGNLKQDVKDLLGESANLFTGFFKRGACTVRAVSDKWKDFARDISTAVDALMKSPFAEDGPEAPVMELSPDAEPMVTVVESIEGNLPIGRQMTLSQANEEIRRLDMQYQEKEWIAQPVKVKIDYTRNGQTDRYWLPLQIGAGGGLLGQMKARLDSYRTDPETVSRLFDTIPEEHRAAFEAELTPFVNENVNKLSTGLLHYFHRHCDIAALEQQFDTQASVLPEKEQPSFRTGAEKTVVGLRRAINTGVPMEQPTVQRERAVTPAQPETADHQPIREKPRQSVRVRLREIKETEAGQPAPVKVRVRPH